MPDYLDDDEPPKPLSARRAFEIPRVHGAWLSHRGKRRRENEDAVCFETIGAALEQPLALEGVRPARKPWLIAVADGMGGHLAGERASLETVRQLAEADPLTPDGITAVLREANRKLYEASRDDPACTAMGATVAGLACGPEGLFAFNVGDARVYRQQDGFLRQITRDDSVAEVLIAFGALDRSAIRPPSLHALTQSIGGHYAYTEIDPHLHPLPTRQRQRFLLCTDGLTDLVPLEELERLVTQHVDAAACANALSIAAMDAGGKDNITIVVADVESGQ